MNYKQFRRLVIGVAAAGAAGVGMAALVSAQTVSVTFPIPELGNCSGRQECHAYCQQPDHEQACVEFAQKHGLISQQQAQQEQKVIQAAQGGGPGGCADQQSCAAYCNDISHMQECAQFAQQHQLMSQSDRQDLSRFQKALESGVQLPGNCQTLDACENYCSQAPHINECVAFGEKSGMIPAKDISQMQKMAQLMGSGQTPGGCQSKQDCEAYCKQPGHSAECVAFGEKMGLLSPQQAQTLQKTGGKGPGGCDSNESCQAYCNQPEHQQECFAFAKENNLIPQDQLQQIQKAQAQVRDQFSNMPAAVKDCLEKQLGADQLRQMASGQFMPGPGFGQIMSQCFMQNVSQGQGGIYSHPQGFNGSNGVPCGSNPDISGTSTPSQPCQRGPDLQGSMSGINGSGTMPNMIPEGARPCPNSQPCGPNTGSANGTPVPCPADQPCGPAGGGESQVPQGGQFMPQGSGVPPQAGQMPPQGSGMPPYDPSGGQIPPPGNSSGQ